MTPVIRLAFLWHSTVNVALLSACVAPGVIHEVARDSPNARADSNYQRCMKSYADIKDSIEGGVAKIEQLCRQGASQTAMTTQVDLSRLRREEEAERQKREREMESLRAEGRRIDRERQAREQAEFDRSSLGRALNSANRAMETHLERRSGTNPPAGGATECPAGEPLFLSQEARAEWEARCGRTSTQRQPLPSGGAIRQTPQGSSPAVALAPPTQSSAGRSVNAAASESPGSSVTRQALTPPFSVGDAPRRAPASNDGPGAVARETFVVNCVGLESSSSGGIQFVNRCPTKVEISWCVENDKSHCKCKGKGFECSTSLSQTRSYSLQDYRNSGGGKVVYGACVSPKTPSDQGASIDQFSCR